MQIANNTADSMEDNTYPLRLKNRAIKKIYPKERLGLSKIRTRDQNRRRAIFSERAREQERNEAVALANHSKYPLDVNFRETLTPRSYVRDDSNLDLAQRLSRWYAIENALTQN